MASLYFRRLHNKITYKARKNYFFPKLFSFLLMVFAVAAVILYTSNFKPVLDQIGASKASSIGQIVINQAVEEILKKEEIVQNKLVTMEKDDSGQICAVSPDFAVMNSLKSELVIKIEEKLYSTRNSKIYIPIGNLTGIDIFSNKGFRIPVDLIPVGMTTVDFNSTFTKAGINQTRLRIAVMVSLDITLLLPDNSSSGANVTTTIPLSETIIVGNVPESYTNIESQEDETRDDLLNILN